MTDTAVADVKTSLKPKFERLIGYLNETNEVLAACFFTDLLVSLLQTQEEEELLALFLELSATAFMGFQFDAHSWALADEILAEAQTVAHTFSATEDHMH